MAYRLSNFTSRKFLCPRVASSFLCSSLYPILRHAQFVRSSSWNNSSNERREVRKRERGRSLESVASRCLSDAQETVEFVGTHVKQDNPSISKHDAMRVLVPTVLTFISDSHCHWTANCKINRFYGIA
jgi:hypothetical protein